MNQDEKGRFLPGNCANPGGRPKLEKTYQEAARALLNSKQIKITFTVEKDGETTTKNINVTADHNMYYAVAATMIIESLKGNHQAAKELIDRVEGRAPFKEPEEQDDLFQRLSQMPRSEREAQINEIRNRRLLPGNAGPGAGE